MVPGGCDKGAEGKTEFCIQHGGGNRCKHRKGCKKLDVGGGFCQAHGGGKRCRWPVGCSKGAVFPSDYCVAHGGGWRCMYPECDKGAKGYPKNKYCMRHTTLLKKQAAEEAQQA